MYRIFAAVIIFVLSFSAVAHDVSCNRPERNMVLGKAPVSIEALERIGVNFAKRNAAAPQVPFAYAHKDWLRVRALHKSGDRFVPYKYTWANGDTLSTGYALMRGPCLVAVLGLSIT